MPSEYLPGFLSKGIKDRIHQFIKRNTAGFHHLLNIIAVHRKSRGIKIHWDHPSPGNPNAKGLVTRDLSKEWDDDEFWLNFKDVVVEVLHATFPGSLLDKNSEGTEFFIKAASQEEKPFAILRIDEATRTCEVRVGNDQFSCLYRTYNEPLRLEAWAEWSNVPGYWHQGIVAEKQGLVDRLLQSIHPDVNPGSVLVKEDYSPLRPWASCINSEPLDPFADFDLLWSKLLELLKEAPQQQKQSSVKLQNVQSDGFTVFSKSSGNRSSWSWTKYRYDKYKKEEAPKVVGPSVELTLGEVVVEHYSAWRELQYRSYINLHKRPLRLQFWAEGVPGRSIRMTEPNAIIYFGLLTMFGKLYERRDAALKEDGREDKPEGDWACCRRSRMRLAAATPKDKDA
mmetsp:Transcript_116583/g.341205  ORF Transcript_116583/g.341205 Transcript_116583/m.341205 type:complete len:396 (-) Transcript_116583:67-1254(-)